MYEIKNNRLLIAFLVAVILVDFMGMATVVVLFPRLLLSADGIFPSAWSHASKIIMMGIFLAIYPLGQVIGATSLGKLSDHYGRKKILLLTLIGTLIGFSLSGIAVLIKSSLILFISRLLSGLCAGNVAIAQASLLDLSTSETKAKNIAYGQMAMGSAYIIGPILGGWLSQSSIVYWFNMSTPFWFFSLVLLGLIILTTTLYKETLIEFNNTKLNIFESVGQIYLALTDKNLSKGFIIWLLFVCGWWLFESFMPAFLFQKFDFDTVAISNVLAFNGALYAAFQYVVVQRLASKMNARSMVAYFTVFAGMAVISLVFVSSAIELYLCMSIFVMAMGFTIPGLITHISNLADHSSQGQVMGMVNSIQAISTVIVMILGGYLNSVNGNISVLGGGFLIVLSWVLFIKLFPSRARKNIEFQNA